MGYSIKKPSREVWGHTLLKQKKIWNFQIYDFTLGNSEKALPFQFLWSCVIQLWNFKAKNEKEDLQYCMKIQHNIFSIFIKIPCPPYMPLILLIAYFIIFFIDERFPYETCCGVSASKRIWYVNFCCFIYSLFHCVFFLSGKGK